MSQSQTPPLEIPPSQGESKHGDRLRAILNLCKRMTSVGDVISLLELITIETKALLKADRVSIFLLDREKCELWSVISQEKRIMRFDARLGIAGSVAMTGQTINVPDAYDHPLFYKEVDLKTGYRTQTLLAVPLRNLRGEIIGVGEAINKETGLFTDEDAEILQTLAAHVSDTIETTQLERQLQDYPLRKENDRPEDAGGGFSTRNIIGMSYRIQSIIRLIDQIRDCSVDVLIEGESGTGKELVAKALHHSSPRSKHPFVAVNCAALPDNLVEAELFGIEKGVATGVDRRIGKFEEAQGGTLFLDEIGDLSLASQAKILRVLQERAVDRVGGRGSVPIDIRVIAATNKDLEAAIKERTFREDLYYRLKVIHIQTPPLREVREDITGLANHFLNKYCEAMQTDPKQFAPPALQSLQSYAWPGNARQLENEVKRLVASVRGKVIAEEQLDSSIRNGQDPVTVPPTVAAPAKQSLSGRRQTLPEAVEALERTMIEEALRETRGNKQQAAQILGLSRQGLIKMLKRLGLDSR
ncbi:MAG TPA: sigma-54-dependent Fis family transcriptional regulator [Candidatus Binatia bacterium]|nr:sigma-54-dependent Fis family transcriptional regulator [Candidatus Binatia bacterium]